jgi:hypothetical protein
MVHFIRVEKVYLETSFFSECVTTRKSDFDVGKRASSNFWWKTQASRFDLYASGFDGSHARDTGFTSTGRQ